MIKERDSRKKKEKRVTQLNADKTVLLFPIAGLLHDYELVRIF